MVVRGFPQMTHHWSPSLISSMPGCSGIANLRTGGGAGDLQQGSVPDVPGNRWWTLGFKCQCWVFMKTFCLDPAHFSRKNTLNSRRFLPKATSSMAFSPSTFRRSYAWRCHPRWPWRVCWGTKSCALKRWNSRSASLRHGRVRHATSNQGGWCSWVPSRI